MYNITRQLTAEAVDLFKDRNRNVLALTKQGPDEIIRRMSAAITLDKELQSEPDFYLDVITQTGPAGRISRDDFRRVIYEALAKQLERTGRAAWVAEEIEALQDPALYKLDPLMAWKRLKPRFSTRSYPS